MNQISSAEWFDPELTTEGLKVVGPVTGQNVFGSLEVGILILFVFCNLVLGIFSIQGFINT